MKPLVFSDILNREMPGRKIPLVTNHVYHIINRGVASQPVFLTKTDYYRMIDTVFYYQNQNPLLSYSHFLRLPTKQKSEFLERLSQKKQFLVAIIALCLLPTHFHLLLKQLKENGISNFMSNLTNSYTRYFNAKNKRAGHLFQGKFKSVLIETDSQLLHVSRYIHLNPFTSATLKTLKELERYPYSSFPEYLGLTKTNFFQKEIVLDQFKDVSSYKRFVFDQAGYQRRLQQIKHLILE